MTQAASSGCGLFLFAMALFLVSFRSLVLANLCASLFMTGVIWFVQVVHYPLFANVGVDGFADYEQRHASRTRYVVAAPMLFELAAAAVVTLVAWRGPWATLLQIAFLLLVVVWLSTFLLQVPCHNRLDRGYDAEVQRRLVRSNWLRTVAWTARSAILVYLIVKI